MPKVSEISPIKPLILKRKRVAAYARVSLVTDQLLHSLSAQVSYYSSLIKNDPEWEFAGVYADEGITGTSTKKRDEFNRLISDCENGLIDLVLVKSISRFARDTVTTLKVTRHLKELGIDVYFEREKIHSMSDEGELMLTLLASFAQEESRSISQNITWRIKKKFEEGIPNGHKAPLGYIWDGEIFRIVPEQGKIVREIYERYLSGESAYKIAKEMKLVESTVKYILSSFAYTGTMILQKSFTTEEHKRRENKGELTRYAVEEMFEPIITQDEYEKVQIIREQRADARMNKTPQYGPFSEMLKCEVCGCSISRRRTKYGIKLVCNTRERKGKAVCCSKPIYEEELKADFCKAFKLNEFDENYLKDNVSLVTIGLDSIYFKPNKGKTRQVIRAYKKGYGAFSGKIKCGCCGKNLKSDTWNIGKKGKKVKTKIWNCRGCKLKRVYDGEFRKALIEMTEEKDVDSYFLQHIENAVAYEDYIEINFKNGERRVWERE